MIPFQKKMHFVMRIKFLLPWVPSEGKGSKGISSQHDPFSTARYRIPKEGQRVKVIMTDDLTT